MSATIPSTWPAGSRVVVFDPTKTCNAVVAPNAKQLAAEPQPVARQTWASGAAVFLVTSSSVSTSEPPAVTLGLTGHAGDRFLLHFVPNGKGSCLWPYRPEIDGAIAASARA